MEVRKEHDDARDREAIDTVNRAAFTGAAEAQVVNDLRANGSLLLSMVACEGDQIIGHIAYSRGVIVSGEEKILSVGLGPMAVLPEYQSKGIGSTLIAASLYTLKEMGEAHVFVLGHIWFYPRFGFVPAENYGIGSVYNAGEHFMAQELVPGSLEGIHGIFLYDAAFDGV